MTFGQLGDLADQVRAIPLEWVLGLSGAQPDRYDRQKWHTAQGVLSVTGAKFMNWNRGQGGGGAIDLVMHLHGLRFGPAVQWLSQSFPSAWPPPSDLRSSTATLALPPPDPGQLGRVRRYLLAARALPSTLIDPLIESGTLYADRPANAVFLLLGKEKQPVGAELRGTTSGHWRGMAPGSRKDLGFFAIPPDPLPKIILVESAIDAISCYALHPDCRCISTAGARPNPHWLAPLVARGHSLYCGFDADPVGENMAQAMMTLHRTIQRLRPPQHDWNDALKAQS